jgi:hypothetical protein
MLPNTLGIRSYGFDSSPIAVAIAKAKLAATDQDEVLTPAGTLLCSGIEPDMSHGTFLR